MNRNGGSATHGGKSSRACDCLDVAIGARSARGAAYVHFFLYLPMGSGPAGPAVEGEVFEQPWTERQVLLVGIGDSVTAGFGAQRGISYFDRLIANPPDEFADMQDNCLSHVLPNLQDAQSCRLRQQLASASVLTFAIDCRSRTRMFSAWSS